MSVAVCNMEERKVNYTAEEIDALLSSGGLERLGMGSRRACYFLPGGRLCAKCYRSDAEIAEGKHPGYQPFKPLPSSVVREIRRFRFDRLAAWRQSRNTLVRDRRRYGIIFSMNTRKTSPWACRQRQHGGFEDAHGPMGREELTTYKYKVRGNDAIRG